MTENQTFKKDLSQRRETEKEIESGIKPQRYRHRQRKIWRTWRVCVCGCVCVCVRERERERERERDKGVWMRPVKRMLDDKSVIAARRWVWWSSRHWCFSL